MHAPCAMPLLKDNAAYRSSHVLHAPWLHQQHCCQCSACPPAPSPPCPVPMRPVDAPSSAPSSVGCLVPPAMPGHACAKCMPPLTHATRPQRTSWLSWPAAHSLRAPSPVQIAGCASTISVSALLSNTRAPSSPCLVPPGHAYAHMHQAVPMFSCHASPSCYAMSSSSESMATSPVPWHACPQR